MMSFVRDTTLWAVRDLSLEQLDARPKGLINSIGTLLAHIVAAEEGWDTPAYVLVEVGRQHIKGHNLEHYLTELATVRRRTLQGFAERDDGWLYDKTPFLTNKPANTYFKWFHVFEDELNQREQIRLIRNLLTSRPSR